MVMSDELRRMLLNNSSAIAIRERARAEGMVSMWRDGMIKVKQSITTPYELVRNIYSIG